jgi:hypothetical protein
VASTDPWLAGATKIVLMDEEDGGRDDDASTPQRQSPENHDRMAAVYRRLQAEEQERRAEDGHAWQKLAEHLRAELGPPQPAGSGIHPSKRGVIAGLRTWVERITRQR